MDMTKYQGQFLLVANKQEVPIWMAEIHNTALSYRPAHIKFIALDVI